VLFNGDRELMLNRWETPRGIEIRGARIADVDGVTTPSQLV